MTTALILIDLQVAYCERDGSFASTGRDVSALASASRIAGEVLEATRRADVPVVHVGRVNDPVAGHPVTLPIVTNQAAGALARGTRDAEFCSSVRPATHEVVLLKCGFSAFHETPLRSVLQRAGVTELLVAGVTTSVCVEHSVRDAVQAGFRVTVIEDACAEWSKRDHEQSTTTMRRWATICKAGDVASRLRGIDQ